MGCAGFLGAYEAQAEAPSAMSQAERAASQDYFGDWNHADDAITELLDFANQSDFGRATRHHKFRTRRGKKSIAIEFLLGGRLRATVEFRGENAGREGYERVTAEVTGPDSVAKRALENMLKTHRVEWTWDRYATHNSQIEFVARGLQPAPDYEELRNAGADTIKTGRATFHLSGSDLKAVEISAYDPARGGYRGSVVRRLSPRTKKGYEVHLSNFAERRNSRIKMQYKGSYASIRRQASAIRARRQPAQKPGRNAAKRLGRTRR
jgi:hypothetical protein